MIQRLLSASAKTLLDFALPARCPGCLAIVEQLDAFCPACWGQVEFMRGGCDCCGLPLEATDAELCGACLARDPVIDRTRSAVAYSDIARDLALRLKYGRKVMLARTMARYMAPLRDRGDAPVVAPVPLHRWRLWGRGFNQAALIADQLARHWRFPVEHRLIERPRPTRSLKGLSHNQRLKTVAGAFRIPDRGKVEGRTVILVDDVIASGATGEACARALKRAGAARVEMVSWARVVRPAQLMR